MAHKKGGGSSTNGRDSHGQRLASSVSAQLVNAGTILVVSAAPSTRLAKTSSGKDDTLFALVTVS